MQLVVYGKGSPSNCSVFLTSYMLLFFFGYFASHIFCILQIVLITCRTLLKISSAILEMLGGSHFHFLVIHVHVNISRFTIYRIWWVDKWDLQLQMLMHLFMRVVPLQILVKAVPIKQGHTLRILFPITPNIRRYKEGPCKYISHLIGHEGEGSLFYILKKLGKLSFRDLLCSLGIFTACQKRKDVCLLGLLGWVGLPPLCVCVNYISCSCHSFSMYEIYLLTFSFLPKRTLLFILFILSSWLNCSSVQYSGWAISLEAGEGDWSHDFSFFSVVIQLTDVGQGEL